MGWAHNTRHINFDQPTKPTTPHPAPPFPPQILWINMVTSSPPALGLACEAAEPDVMAREPVMKGRLLANRLQVADTLFYGFVSGILGFLCFVFVAYVAGPGVGHTHNCNYILVSVIFCSCFWGWSGGCCVGMVGTGSSKCNM